MVQEIRTVHVSHSELGSVLELVITFEIYRNTIEKDKKEKEKERNEKYIYFSIFLFLY